jgi:hypothetical protein
MPELEEDLVLRDEVTKRLGDVGLLLLDKPGIPYLGVAVGEAHRSGENLSDVGLNTRSLGLLLFLWLRLVAPLVYGEQKTPVAESSVVSEETLLGELPGHWNKTTLQQHLGRLRRLHFVEHARGEEGWSAGPMLWMAINHDQLSQFLRSEKGLRHAVERYLRLEQANSGEA